jgi:hypothetical protein
MLRLTAILLVALVRVAAADIVIVEDAIEAQPLRLQVTSDSTGVVYAVACDACKPVQLVITSTTKASIGGRPLALAELAQYSELGATVFYDKASRIVTRIEVWQ